MWGLGAAVRVKQVEQAPARQDLEKAVVETQQLLRKHEQEVLPTRLRRDTARSAANRVGTYCMATKCYASTGSLCVMIVFLSGE